MSKLVPLALGAAALGGLAFFMSRRDDEAGASNIGADCLASVDDVGTTLRLGESLQRALEEAGVDVPADGGLGLALPLPPGCAISLRADGLLCVEASLVGPLAPLLSLYAEVPSGVAGTRCFATPGIG